jgi:hypothetical protein
VIVATPPQWLLANTNGVLTWYPTTDPDAGDSIRAYRLQIDDDADFTSPLVDDESITVTNLNAPVDWTISVPLHRFAAASGLTPGLTYHWRVGAQDSRYKWSDWNIQPVSFAFGFIPIPPTTLDRVTAVAPDQVRLEWTGANTNVRIEFTPTLNPPTWDSITGPLAGTE